MWFFRLALLMLLTGTGYRLWGQQISESVEVPELPDAPDLPDAPQSQNSPKTTDGKQATAQKKCPPVTQPAQGLGGATGAGEPQKGAQAGCHQKFNILYPLGKPPGRGHPLTSKDKLRIAASNVVDPFNLLTIGATAAITVGSDPNTGYGPGMKGWTKNSGTLLTEDMTGAFFVTYLIPSIAKEDPRYYRMPTASIPRRIENAIIQPVWTRSDKGDHMPNYAMLIGVPASIALSNVYVPGRKRGFWPTAGSSAAAIASAPIDNFVSEFLPDVAKRVSVHIVLIQRIVNHMALTEGTP
jgi:hypothetical protein